MNEKAEKHDSISRQAAIQTALDFIVEYLSGAFDEDFQRKLIERMSALPSLQPERKKGKWINAYPDIEPNPMFMYGICSVCGYEQAISNKLNFCPNCGADMRGKQNGQ